MNNSNISILEEKIKTGLQLLNDIYADYIFESEEFDFQQKARQFIDLALKILYNAKEQLNDNTLYSLVYECMELDKNIRINYSFSQQTALNNSSYQENKLLFEKEIRQEYETIKRKITNVTPDDSLFHSYSDQLFSLQLNKDSLMDDLSKSGDQIHKGVSYKDCIDLINQESLGLMLFYRNELHLYQLFLSSEQQDFNSLDVSKIDPALKNHFASIRNFNEKQYDKNKALFLQSSQVLYQELIGTLKQDILPFSLVILPDGELSYMSFDLLLKHTQAEAYKDLPYLIMDHSISYLGSVSQMLRFDSDKSTGHDYLGFAPIYAENQTNTSAFRSDLNQLLHNQNEVINCSGLFNGEYFLGADATETNFKEHMKKTSILHLAMHATVNDENPMESYLNFYVDSTQIDDGKLYMTEISKMNLNSDLVILSACQTNTGEQIQGQGLTGIARAFQNANNQNILYTNWVVDDKSSQTIIQSFLEKVKSGQSAPISLREAKLHYLKQSPTARTSPIHWAGYNYYGALSFGYNNPSNRNSHLLMGVVFLVGFLMIGNFFIKKMT